MGPWQARPACSWVKEAAATSVPQARGAAITPSQPCCLFFPWPGQWGSYSRTQDWTGLWSGCLPLAPPGRPQGLPCRGSLTLPADALQPPSWALLSYAWKIMNPNPECSSHLRAGQTWPPLPPQGRQESGVLLGHLCCRLRVRMAKQSVLWEGMALTILSTQWFKSVLHSSASHCGEGICPAAGEAGGCCWASAAAAATAAQHSSPVCRLFRKNKWKTQFKSDLKCVCWFYTLNKSRPLKGREGVCGPIIRGLLSCRCRRGAARSVCW